MQLTPQVLRDACRQHQQYTSCPELNEALYLNHKGIEALAHLEPYHGLRALYVEGNALSTLQGLEALTSLRTLHAAKNLLRSLGGLPASLTALEVLDVSQCFITSCAGLSALVNLRSLNLSANKLTSAADLAELPGCTALQTLDLSANQLAGEGVLQLLADAPWQLALLRLHGNPVVSQTTHYRKQLITALPSLNHLEDAPITDNDRRLAAAFFRGGVAAERAERDVLRQEADAAAAAHRQAFDAMVAAARAAPDDAPHDPMRFRAVPPGDSESDDEPLPAGFSVQQRSNNQQQPAAAAASCKPADAPSATTDRASDATSLEDQSTLQGLQDVQDSSGTQQAQAVDVSTAAAQAGPSSSSREQQLQQDAAGPSSGSSSTGGSAALRAQAVGGGPWYRSLWEQAVQVGERQEAAAAAESGAGASSSQPLQEPQQLAPDGTPGTATADAAVQQWVLHDAVEGSTPPPTATDAASIADSAMTIEDPDGAASQADGAPLSPSLSTGSVPHSSSGLLSTAAAGPAATGAGAGGSLVGLPPWPSSSRDGRLSDGEDSAILLTHRVDHFSTTASRGSSTRAMLAIGNSLSQREQQQGQQGQQQQQQQQQQAQQPSAAQLRRQDSASMQGPWGVEPEQHAMFEQQQQVRQADVDSDALLHQGSNDAGASSSSNLQEAPAAAAAAGGLGAAVAAGSALSVADRAAAHRQHDALGGQDSDMLLARGAHHHNRRPQAATGADTSSSRSPQPLAVEPRMDSATELSSSSGAAAQQQELSAAAPLHTSAPPEVTVMRVRSSSASSLTGLVHALSGEPDAPAPAAPVLLPASPPGADQGSLAEARRLVLGGMAGPSSSSASAAAAAMPAAGASSYDDDDELPIDREVYFAAASAIHDEDSLAAARRAVLGGGGGGAGSSSSRATASADGGAGPSAKGG